MTDTDTAETVEIQPRTWDLTPAQFQATCEKIDKINARAEKRGFTGRYEVHGEEFLYEQANPFTGLVDRQLLVKTTIAGEAPRYEGSRFLARVEWNEGQPIIQAAPGVEGVDRSILVAGHCAHCNKIRSRRNTYVVERDGVQVQIGGTCIKDYLGWSATPAFLSTDDVKDEVDRFFSGQDFEQSFSPLTILQTAWAAIRTFGFVRAGAYDGRPTAALVKYALGVYRLPNHRVERGGCSHCELVADLEKLGALVDDAAAEAQRVLDFVLSDDFSGSSEYVQNLKTIAAASAVEGKFIGLLASAPQAYAKHLEKTLIRKAREERPSEHVGAVKERLTLTVTIENVRYIDSEWGTTTLYTLRDPETGNVFKWFASSEKLGDQRNVTVTIKATVKKHEIFNGLKSTVLTRCAVQD